MRETQFLSNKNIINPSTTELFAFDIQENIKDNHSPAVENRMESIPPIKLFDDDAPEFSHIEVTLERSQWSRQAQIFN